jgi:hypothetical protein
VPVVRDLLAARRHVRREAAAARSARSGAAAPLPADPAP